jgi:hypothetical protein
MKINQPSRRRPSGTRLRLAAALAAGAVVAGGLVAWDDLHHHASLVAEANGPQPKGVHETVGSILAIGGVFTFLVVAVAVFAVATMVARARKGRPAAPPYPAAAERRRSRAPARW